MVDKIHYRWDFIGLSTDSKPTPAESPKVVDGSTFYESNTSKLYVFYKDTWYEKTATGGGASYTAGNGIDITDNTISVDTTDIQEKLTAGSNITISEQNEISATDTTYSNFTGTDGTTTGSAGLVPAPATTDAGKYLKSDGTWGTVQAGPTVVQTVGSSTTDVMSQNATTKMVFTSSSKNKIQIGDGATASGYNAEVAIGMNAKATGTDAIAIGNGTNSSDLKSIAIGDTTKSTKQGSIGIGCLAESTGKGAIAIGGDGNSGRKAVAAQDGAVAIGAGAKTTSIGEFNIGSAYTSYGYNSTNYRLLTGLYDGQSAHDAVTVEQVNSVIDAINTALSTSIPHIGA